MEKEGEELTSRKKISSTEVAFFSPYPKLFFFSTKNSHLTSIPIFEAQMVFHPQNKTTEWERSTQQIYTCKHEAALFYEQFQVMQPGINYRIIKAEGTSGSLPRMEFLHRSGLQFQCLPTLHCERLLVFFPNLPSQKKSFFFFFLMQLVLFDHHLFAGLPMKSLSLSSL